MLKLPVVYAPLQARLALINRRLDLVRFLAEYNRLPADLTSERQLAEALLQTLDSIMGTHYVDADDMVDNAHQEGREFDMDLDLPLHEVLHFSGIDEDQDWDNFSELWKLAISFTFAGRGFGSYDKEASVWWRDNTKWLQLPNLNHLDYAEIQRNLAELPAPWNGLAAILTWLEADTGNIFVDVPCEYSMEYGVDYIWTLEDLHLLVNEYQWADQHIFQPAAALEKLFAQRRDYTIRRCVDLALGRVPVQDGEIIWMDDEPEFCTLTQPINCYEGDLVYA